MNTKTSSVDTELSNLDTELSNFNTQLATLNSRLFPVGSIIQSTTLDTEAKVKAIYGGTSWSKIVGEISARSI